MEIFMEHEFSKFYILGVKMQGFKRFKEEYEVSLDKMTAGAYAVDVVRLEHLVAKYAPWRKNQI